MPININLGNIFEGGSHLTVLPASAKGTISSSCRRWVESFELNSPPFEKSVKLGDISDLLQFPKPEITDYYCFAYSVFNDNSSTKALTEIGKSLGQITQNNENIRIVETPLLGTGAGGLDNSDAAKALIRGFAETAHSDTDFNIFVYDAERHKALQKHLKGFIKRIWDALQLKPGFGGINIDLKKL